MTQPTPDELETVDACLADLPHEEYLRNQAAFPGFVDDDGNDYLDSNVGEGDTYAHEG